MAFWTEGGSAKDPKRNFRFKVVINGFISANNDLPDVVAGENSTVWWAKKVQKPNWTVAESKHVFMGHTFYWPGKTEWQEISLTLVDPVSPNATAILSHLTERSGYDLPQVNEPFLTQSKKKSTDALVSVEIIQIDSNDNAIETWKLHHPFIKKVSFSDLDYENDDLTTVDVTLRYDWAEWSTENGDGIQKPFFAKNGPSFP